MSEFINMVERFDKRNEDDEGSELNKFFGLLKQMNNKDQLNMNTKRKIEQYFNHRWENDRSNLFDLTDKSDLISQLPEFVQDNLISSYLYVAFLKELKQTFQIPKQHDLKCSRYVWGNTSYRNFMFILLKRLEPNRYVKNEIIYEELDEISEVTYIIGSFYVGHSINRKMIFRLKQSNMDIGAYNLTFNKSCHYIFKSAADSDGFFIRRHHWFSLMKDTSHDDVFIHDFKDHVRDQYSRQI